MKERVVGIVVLCGILSSKGIAGIYRGGTDDGYVCGEYDPGIESISGRYRGGRDDGYVCGEYDPGIESISGRYRGGRDDGYVCGENNNQVVSIPARHRGGRDDGFAFIELGSTPIGVEVVRFGCRDSLLSVILSWSVEVVGGVKGYKILKKEKQAKEFYEVKYVREEGKKEYRIVDTRVKGGGVYYYKLVVVKPGEKYSIYGPVECKVKKYPIKFFVKREPNPAEEIVYIRLGVPKKGYVVVKIYDKMGRLVKRVFEGNLGVGFYFMEWKGEDENKKKVGSGVYFLYVKTQKKEIKKKIVLM